MKLVITVPEQLFEVPSYWPPRMPVDIAALEEDGEPVLVFDNYIFRYNVEVVKEEYAGVKEDPSEIYLWASPRSYPHLESYLKAFPSASVIGFPKNWIDGFEIKEVKHQPMPAPALNKIPLQVYYANCKLSYTPESLASQRFCVLDFDYYGQRVSAKRAAQVLLSLRLKYACDFFVIDTDLMVDNSWTSAFLHRLEDFEISRVFNWVCRGNVKGAEASLLKSLADSGCQTINLGELDVTELGSEPYRVRLPAMVEACRATGLAVTVTPTLGMPNTLISDVAETTKLLKAYGLTAPPKGIGTDAFPSLFEKVADRQQLLRNLALRKANLTPWNDAVFYGLLRLMELGEVEKIQRLG